MQLNKKISGLPSHTTTTRNQPISLILVGTAYMDQETMPSRGRLLIFKLNAKECRIELLKQVNLQGSIQAISTLRENHKFLVLGQNNRVSLFNFALCYGPDIQLTKLDSKVSGAYVQCIKTIGDQIVVGDILKGVIIFDLKEGRQQKFTLQDGPSSGQVNTWVNDILILSKNKYMIMDHMRNIFVFERNM